MSTRWTGATVMLGAAVILGGAACGEEGGTGGAGGAGGSGVASSSSSSSSSSGGSSPGTMVCDLQFSEASGSNLALTSFSSAAGQGNTTHEDGHPIEYGIAASANTSTSSVILNITVSGDAPAQGSVYIGDSVFVDLTINDVVGGTGLHDWVAAPASKVTIAAVGPGPVPHYTNVVFQLDGVTMQPSTMATMNNATGTFEATGQCAGNIQDLQ